MLSQAVSCPAEALKVPSAALASPALDCKPENGPVHVKSAPELAGTSTRPSEARKKHVEVQTELLVTPSTLASRPRGDCAQTGWWRWAVKRTRNPAPGMVKSAPKPFRPRTKLGAVPTLKPETGPTVQVKVAPKPEETSLKLARGEGKLVDEFPKLADGFEPPTAPPPRLKAAPQCVQKPPPSVRQGRPSVQNLNTSLLRPSSA